MHSAQLVSALAGAGAGAVELRAPDGGSAVLLPFGARVIGLFAAEGGENFLHAHPALGAAETAGALLRTAGFTNTGGDRTWLAPEAETTIGDLARPLETYAVPPEIDPGRYALARDGDDAVLRGRGRVPLHRHGGQAEVELEKRWRLLPHPLRRDGAPAGVAYIGYEQTVTLRLIDCTPPAARLGLWQLLVLPAGGWLIVPTLRRAAVRDIFATAGPAPLQAGARGVRFGLDGRARHKIALRAADLTGRAGYLRARPDGAWTLVVRNFAVNPSGDYVDVPWDRPDDEGYAFQAYNDDGSSGAFGELEYHAPAIGGPGGRTACTDVSQLWAFQGPRAAIRALARRLLGVTVAISGTDYETGAEFRSLSPK